MGIERIYITDSIVGRGAWRFIWARDHWSAANAIYHDAFAELGMPLSPGSKIIRCSKAQRDAMVDRELGIDVYLHFENGMQATLQEKFLSYRESTVTVEYMQDPRLDEEGDFFNLRCQYYFVAYDRSGSADAYRRLRTSSAIRRQFDLDNLRFEDWILCDWLATTRATLQNRLHWNIRANRHDGARANFAWAYFDDIPDDCVMARYDEHTAMQRALW